jgi:cytochrome c oxidase assembly factor CtaG
MRDGEARRLQETASLSLREHWAFGSVGNGHDEIMILASTSLWLRWNFEPITVLLLAAVTGAYFYALGPLRRRYHLAEKVDRGKVAFFVAGMTLLALALLSPLDYIGMEYLLTAHMLQHMLFSVVCPPLILLGVPGWMLDPLFRGPRVQRAARIITHPAVAFGLYNLNMWIWHLPALFDAEAPSAAVIGVQVLESVSVIGALIFAALFLPGALKRDRAEHLQSMGSAAPQSGSLSLLPAILSAGATFAIIILAVLGALNPLSWGTEFEPHNPLHMVMDAMFIGTAIIYWMPILSPVRAVPRISPLFGMLYMFMSAMPMMVIGALLTFAPDPLYTRYANAPLLWGFTRLGDQQFAGLTMWLPMDIPLLLTISILFFRWINEQDLAERAAAGEFDEVFDPAPAPTPAVSPVEMLDSTPTAVEP